MAETIDQDGTHVVWVATGGGGIARYAKGQWRVLDVSSGLPIELCVEFTYRSHT